jgi:hypothetical protein
MSARVTLDFENVLELLISRGVDSNQATLGLEAPSIMPEVFYASLTRM